MRRLWGIVLAFILSVGLTATAVAELSLSGDEAELTAVVGESTLTYELKKDSATSDRYAVVTHFTPVQSLIIPGEIDGYPVKSFSPNPSTDHKAEDYSQRQEALQSILFEEGVEEIGREAFSGYRSLRSVSLPSSLKTIGYMSFYGCRALSEFLFHPDSTNPSIGMQAFWGVGMEDLILPSGESLAAKTEESGINYYFQSYGDGWDYLTLADGTLRLTIWADFTRDVTILEIPSEIHGKPVTELGTDMVFYCDWLEKVILPEGLRRIEARAFCGCRSLKEVNLPESLEWIGDAAFADIAARELQVPPDTKTSLFWFCSTIQKDRTGEFEYGMQNDGTAVITRLLSDKKTVKIPAEVDGFPVSTIAAVPSSRTGSAANNNVTSITIAEGITTLGDEAFSGYTKLTQIKFPKGLTSIGRMAFNNTGLKSLQLPEAVQYFAEAPFYNSEITSLTLPKGMTEIPDRLCYGMSQLKSINLPKGVTRIGKEAFAGCPALRSITFPEGLLSIGSHAFAHRITTVQRNYQNTNGKKTYASLQQLKFPASLQIIEENAFQACDALTSITFAKNAQLTTIGDNAFTLCLRLKEIKLPDSVKSIGEGAFTDNLRLQKVDLGSGVEHIGAQLFLHDQVLKSLTVPDSLVEIGDSIIEDHGEGLVVTCGEGSAMEAWLQANDPDVSIQYPKKKK